ncbi:MAG: hypothetical protein KDI13_10150 [Alphaproteobacteria bacterium]|nr:hypothetical protein [Alphaproteobacteria bacterium]
MTLWTPDHGLVDGPYKVLLARGEFTDPARGDRVVPFKVYYPVEHGLSSMPVILWSHGFGGSRDGAGFIARYVASHGYVLVHMTHYGTDSSLWEGKPGHPWDILRQTKVPREMTLARMSDVPFVLDSLPQWAKDNPEPGAYMDFERIGMSGHSFGAMTTMTAAGMLFPFKDGSLRSLRDERIKAGILYSPTPISHLTDAPPEELYGPVSIPLFHMTGTEDDSPLAHHGFAERLDIHKHVGHPDQYLQVLEGGDHMVYNGTRGKLEANPKREEHEEDIKVASLAFWDAYLKDDDKALAWMKEKWSVR